MKLIETNGKGLDDLHVIERDLDAPGPGQLRLEMLAMTINPADLLMLEGRYGVRPKHAFTPGAEGVARVAELGDGVSGFAVGDIVIPMAGSAWVEEMVTDARSVIALKPGVDLDQAAMLKANPATALVMLQDIAAVRPGDYVIQNAANSAVGGNVIAIARKLGIETLNIVRRPEAAEQLRAQGADNVFVDTPGAGAPRCKLALDAIGGAATAILSRQLENGGKVSTYGLLSGQPCQVDAHDLVFRDVTLRGFWLADWFKTATPARISQVYAQLVDWLDEGVVGAPVAGKYPIEQVKDAVAHAARENRDGKILLTTRHYS